MRGECHDYGRHPLPPVNEEMLEGPEVGTLCMVTGKYRPGLVVRVVQRSYVWSPGECAHNGGYRHYDWSVVTDDHGYRVVMNDSDLIPITTGMTLSVTEEDDR